MGKGDKIKRKYRKLRSINAPYKEEERKEDNPPEWVVDIAHFLEQGKTYESGTSWTIYRVPTNLWGVQKSAFVPKIISIGPFYYLDDRLQAMNDDKTRYLLRLLGGKFGKIDGTERAKDDVDQSQQTVRLEDLVEAMKALELKTRECYSETFDEIDSDEFVHMMVADGCFIIELLRLYYKFTNKVNVDDPIFTIRWMLPTLQRDLLMLENQLPFFLLEELYKLTSPGKEPPLKQLAITFFSPLLPREEVSFEMDLDRKYKHLLDVFRYTFISKVKKKVAGSLHKKGNANHYCAEELQEAGIALQKREEAELIDIKFNEGTLHIPPLTIDDNTVPLFLNFVAYEQCDEEANSFFTNYFMFLDSLINTGKDVQILHNSGIINHVLGSDEDVASLINKLCREIVYDLDHCHLSSQMKSLNHHCRSYYENKWRFWWRNLIRDYFSSPWTLISLVAAIYLLLLTTAHTFYSIYSYYRPR